MERDFSRYAFPILHLSLGVIVSLCMCLSLYDCVSVFS